MQSCDCSSGVYKRLLSQPQAPLASPIVRTPARYQSYSLECLLCSGRTLLYGVLHIYSVSSRLKCVFPYGQYIQSGVAPCMRSRLLAISVPAVVCTTLYVGSKWKYAYTTYQNPLVLRHQGLNTSGVDGANSADP